MVTLSTADKVLKSLYLDVICDQLNNKTSPFLSAIKKGSEDITGKNAIVVCRHGINGGMGSAAETGNLPQSYGNSYINLTVDLKNIFGTIEISDKALRAGQQSASSLVNVLNAEMDGLLEAAKFNFSRMIWQDGLGILASVGGGTSTKTTIYVTSTVNLVEGMIVDFVSVMDAVLSSGHRITKVNKTNKSITITPAIPDAVTISNGSYISLQQSYGQEIFGIPYLFATSIPAFYGNTRSTCPIVPQTKTITTELTPEDVQEVLDDIESGSGNDIDMIITGFDLRRSYLKGLQASKTNIDYMNLDGGFKALSHGGIPLVTDRFCADKGVYFVNTKDYKLVQLGDWQWIQGDNGNVLAQLDKTPTYTGTLVKYANLVCTRPLGQAKLFVNK